MLNNVAQVAFYAGARGQGVPAGPTDTCYLASEIACLKQQHFEELAAAERRRTESVRAFQDQLDEMSKSLEEIRTQRDLTLTD